MRDFDEEAGPPTPEDERTFKIGGSRFIARAAIDVGVWAHFWDSFNGSRAGTVSNLEYVAAQKQIVEQMLEPAYLERWHALIADPDVTVTAQQIDQIIVFLWEVASGRPTPRAASSSDGPGSNGTSSTEKPAEQASPSPA